MVCLAKVIFYDKVGLGLYKKCFCSYKDQVTNIYIEFHPLLKLD